MSNVEFHSRVICEPGPRKVTKRNMGKRFIQLINQNKFRSIRHLTSWQEVLQDHICERLSVFLVSTYIAAMIEKILHVSGVQTFKFVFSQAAKFQIGRGLTNSDGLDFFSFEPDHKFLDGKNLVAAHYFNLGVSRKTQEEVVNFSTQKEEYKAAKVVEYLFDYLNGLSSQTNLIDAKLNATFERELDMFFVDTVSLMFKSYAHFFNLQEIIQGVSASISKIIQRKYNKIGARPSNEDDRLNMRISSWWYEMKLRKMSKNKMQKSKIANDMYFINQIARLAEQDELLRRLDLQDIKLRQMSGSCFFYERIVAVEINNFKKKFGFE